jgi:hypothetical protein
MNEPSPTLVTSSIVEGIKNAQNEISTASKGLLCWAPEYLMTVNIFQSLSRIKALQNNLVLETGLNDGGVKSPGRKLKNSRTGQLCRCDMVVWSDDRRRAVIEVKRHAWKCQQDVARILQLFKEFPDINYGVLAACVHKELKNTDELMLRNKIVNDLEIISQNIRQKVKNVEIFPRNVKKQIYPVYAEDGNGEGRTYLWRPVCFVIKR